MSRPALPPGQAASAMVKLRVLPRQKSAWVRAAQRAGQNHSAWLARLADAETARLKESPPPPPPPATSNS